MRRFAPEVEIGIVGRAADGSEVIGPISPIAAIASELGVDVAELGGGTVRQPGYAARGDVFRLLGVDPDGAD